MLSGAPPWICTVYRAVSQSAALPKFQTRSAQVHLAASKAPEAISCHKEIVSSEDSLRNASFGIHLAAQISPNNDRFRNFIPRKACTKQEAKRDSLF